MPEARTNFEKNEAKPEKKEQKQEVLWHTHVPIFDAKKMPDIGRAVQTIPLHFIDSPSPELIHAYAEFGPRTEENFLALLEHRVPLREISKFPFHLFQKFFQKIHHSVLSAEDGGFFTFLDETDFFDDFLRCGRVPDLLKKILDAGIDAKQLFLFFKQKERLVILLKNISLLPLDDGNKTTINAAEFANACLERDECIEELFLQRNAFPGESLNIDLLCEKLAKQGRAAFLLAHFDEFPGGALNIHDLGEKMISEKKYQDFFTYIDTFKQKNFDIHLAIEKIFKNGEEAVLFPYLGKIFLSADQLKILFERSLKNRSQVRNAILCIEHLPAEFDITQIAIDLLALTRPIFIFEKFEKFVARGIDVRRFLDAVFLSWPGLIYSIFTFIEKIPLEPSDIQKIITKALEEGLYMDLVIHFQKFPLGSIDPEMLVRKILEKSQTKAKDLFHLYKNLPPDSFDIQAAVDALVAEGKISDLLVYYEAFSRYIDLARTANDSLNTQDAKLLVDYFPIFEHVDFEKEEMLPLLIHNQDYGCIFRNINIFSHFSRYIPDIITSWVTNKKYADLEMYSRDLLAKSETPTVHARMIAEVLKDVRDYYVDGGKDVLGLLECLMDAGLDLDEFSLEQKECLAEYRLPINEALMQERYAIPAVIARWRRELGIETTDPTSFEGLRKKYDLLLRDGRTKQAKHLAAYVKELGVTLDGAEDHYQKRDVGRDIQEFEADIPRRMQEKDFIFPHREAIAFYVHDSINRELALLKVSQKRTTFSQRNLCESLRKRSEIKQQSIVLWLRWYIVHAVISEMTGQEHEGAVVPFLKMQDVIAGSQEGVLDLLASAAARFRSSQAFPIRDTGGDAWAKIAETGYALWASEHPSVFLIDLVLQLEHNAGMFFDKDIRIISFNNAFMQKALSENFRATDMRSYLAAFSDEMLPAQEREELSDVLWEVERLKQSLMV